VAIREREIQEHKINVPARQAVQTGEQGLGTIELKLGVSRILERCLDKFGIAGVVFNE
jgi:hypothetical protein